MGFGLGKDTIFKEDILEHTTEGNIIQFYLGVSKIPTLINSPFRKDDKPSFGFFSPDGKSIMYKDFATKESGNTFSLLSKLWNLSYTDTLKKIYNDLPNISGNVDCKKCSKTVRVYSNKNSEVKCKVREWRDYDIAFWEKYGIPISWIKWADVHPISHIFVYTDNNKYVINADKYAYAFVERKEGNITLKIYQPYNTKGFKWTNKHDKSVISLWTKLPAKGDRVCICSSLKDALCLWHNTGIPSIAMQGEGYTLSNTVIKQLKERFTDVYILLDNDDAGIIDGKKLAELTGFTNLVLPRINDAKDISDLYKSLTDKKEFKQIILNLFNNDLRKEI